MGNSQYFNPMNKKIRKINEIQKEISQKQPHSIEKNTSQKQAHSIEKEIPQQQPHSIQKEISQKQPHSQILEITHSKVNDSNIDYIIGKPWPFLRWLDLGINEISSKGVKKLMQRQWPQLKSLFLRHNKIGNEGFKYILQKESLNLQLLNLYNCSIASVDCLLAIKHPIKLITINIDHNNIGSRGAKMLAKADFPLLKCVSLGKCSLGNQGIKHLSKYKPIFAWLNLRNNEIGYDGYLSIIDYKWVNYSVLVTEIRNNFISYLSICSSNLVVSPEIGIQKDHKFFQDFGPFKHDFEIMKKALFREKQRWQK